MTKSTAPATPKSRAKPKKAEIAKPAKPAKEPKKAAPKKEPKKASPKIEPKGKKTAAAPKVAAAEVKAGGSSSILELCLLLDCTGSMGSWIARSKDTLKEII